MWSSIFLSYSHWKFEQRHNFFILVELLIFEDPAVTIKANCFTNVNNFILTIQNF